MYKVQLSGFTIASAAATLLLAACGVNKATKVDLNEVTKVAEVNALELIHARARVLAQLRQRLAKVKIPVKAKVGLRLLNLIVILKVEQLFIPFASESGFHT